MTIHDFDDIRPFLPEELPGIFQQLLSDPEFKGVLQTVYKDVPLEPVAQLMLSCKSSEEFQIKMVKPMLDQLLANASKGLTSDYSALDNSKHYTFISNHRDIVLDSAQLSYLLIKGGRDACEIAIGNNLLIYDWITKLVRMNKSFIVKRNLGRIQTLTAAVQLSGYMHFAVQQKHASLWIAQREGRCKDSNDRTQESLIKMLAYGNRDKSFIESLKELNIAPISISYEYDPNDFLKAKEFLCKSKNPNWRKAPEDDLISMKTGIVGHKGEVHYAFTPCINEELDKIPEGLDKFLEVDRVCAIIDHAIHQNYKIYKNNYIAHDILFDDKHFADKYTQEEREAFEQYLSSQIDKTEGLKLSEADRFYMYNKMLQMYSNPLTNYLEATK